MRLSIIITACSLSSSVLAIPGTIFDDRKLFVRMGGASRSQKPGRRLDTKQITASSSPQRSRASSPDGWSDTSDSARSSLDSPRQGGSGETVVKTWGPNRITHKTKGGSKPFVIETGDGWGGERFIGPRKSRTKITGLSDHSSATVRMQNGKTKLVVDTRRSGGESGSIGARIQGDYPFLDDVEQNNKVIQIGDTSAKFERMALVRGRGTIRAALVPKREKNLDIPKRDQDLEMPE